MTPELQNKLFAAFPKLFVQKDMDMQHTCMCWGIDCPDEWYDVIYRACNLLQSNIDWNNKEQIEFTQVKEKFGSLCMYMNSSDDWSDGVVAMANAMVYKPDRDLMSYKEEMNEKLRG